MIYLVDLLSIGNSHLMYNYSVIRLFRYLYPDQKIVFYSEETHQDLVRELLDTKDNDYVIYKKIKLSFTVKMSFKKLRSFFSNLYQNIGLLRTIISEMKRTSSTELFICTSPILSLLNFKYFDTRNINVLITLHGEVEYIFNQKTFRDKVIGNLYARLLKSNNSNFKFLLLTKISKSILLQRFHSLNNRLVDINHPYHFLEKDDYSINDTSTIHIGHIGSMGLRKNSQYLYLLAESIKDYILTNSISLYSIGALENNILPYRNDLVNDFTSINKDQYISRDIYSKMINNLNYSIFFFGEDQFLFRASGALLDAIQYEKPFICLKHPYFEYLFTIGGDVGFMCETLDDIKRLVVDLANKDQSLLDRYASQVYNLHKLKNLFTIETVALDFINQYKNISILQ